jgi:hypothetical protein
MSKEQFVIIKLVSGEQLMATLTDEDESTLHIDYPMLIRLVPFVQSGKAQEHVTASPLCQFSEDKHFSIPKNTVIFVKKLHSMIVPHYTRLVDEHETSVLVRQEEDGSVSRVELGEEEEEDLTVEEISKRIDMLESIMTSSKKKENKEEKEKRFFVEGNDTVN